MLGGRRHFTRQELLASLNSNVNSVSFVPDFAKITNLQWWTFAAFSSALTEECVEGMWMTKFVFSAFQHGRENMTVFLFTLHLQFVHPARCEINVGQESFLIVEGIKCIIACSFDEVLH